MGPAARSATAAAVKPRVRTLVALSLVGIPLVAATVASRVLTDVLWFREVGQEDVFIRMLEAKLVLVVAAGGFSGAFLIGNAWLAIRAAPFPISRRLQPIAFVGCGLIATVIGWGARKNWQLLLLWAHRQSFGLKDPLHHRDIGFFVFSLPFLERLSNLLFLIGAVGATVALVIHTLTGALTWRPLAATRRVRIQLALLGGFGFLLLALRLHLMIFSAELEPARAGRAEAFPGPHYVDVHVRMLGLRVLVYLAVASAVGLAAAPFLGTSGHTGAARRAAIGPVVAMVIVAIASESWAPALVQRYVVNGDPVIREAPFLKYALNGTRRGFGLSAVRVYRFVPRATLTSDEIRKHLRQLDDVQVWDTDISRLEMQQLASDTPFYRPGMPTLDAVTVEGKSKLALTAARELDVDRVRGASGWENSRLVYTHSIGAFRFSATGTDPDGLPSSDDHLLALGQPRIYFGPQQAHAARWAVVDTRRAEFDQPTAAKFNRPGYHYAGSGGIALSNLFVRAAFALRLTSLPLLVSSQVTSGSRIIMHRGVLDRLRTIAPFISWDPHPSTVVVGGRIVFLSSGYAVSDSYPYAPHVGIAGSEASYARLAVEATVAAYSGQVRLYAVDQSDPILRAWMAAFPGMFQPISRMPRAIRQRLRYPSALFDAQAALYERFHTTDPTAFASNADAWSAPTSLSGPIEKVGSIRFDPGETEAQRNGVTPAYAFATPAGQVRPHLLRSAYFSPVGAQNLVAALDGWITPNGAPELSSRSLPRNRVTLGPAQISRLVLLTPRISRLLGVRNKELNDIGKSSLSSVWLGTPHIVFFAGAIIQIQTIYAVSSGRGLARKLGVTVFINGHAGIGDSVRAALRQASRSA